MSAVLSGDAIRKRAVLLRGSAWTQLGVVGPVFVIMVGINLDLNPERFAPGNLSTTLGLAAPVLLVAMASTPALLGGGGGIDISIGPMVGLLNVLMVKAFFIQGTTSPWVVLPSVIIAGLLLGAANGLLVVFLRLQPIVATLATYLIFAGLAPYVLSDPQGTVPGWLASLGSWASFIPIVSVIAVWTIFRRLPAHPMLLAVGGSDRAAYSAGLPVAGLRIASYAFGGLFASAAALSLTGLIGSGDPSVGPTFTLQALAAVALGGVSLAGGRGGLLQASTGALVIVLIEMMLTSLQVSTFVLRIVYGAVLLAAVVANALVARSVKR